MAIDSGSGVLHDIFLQWLKDELKILSGLMTGFSGLHTPVWVWGRLWWAVYVIVKVLSRALVGRDRFHRVAMMLGLTYTRAYSIIFGSLDPYEPYVTRVLRRSLRKSVVFMDLGSYVGQYALYAYRPLKGKRGGKIVAVEPDPVNFKSLMRKIPGDGKVKVVNAAIWTEDGLQLKFFVGIRNRSD
ncbi:MAG: hypothetical protein RMJ75_05555 [Nitrososphaerota archaeon]|nr:hypothetical protein [Nitrososphaerota archaeon]